MKIKKILMFIGIILGIIFVMILGWLVSVNKNAEENIINEFPSTMEAERQTGFNQSNISNCLKGKRKTCGGFIWKYKTKNGED